MKTDSVLGLKLLLALTLVVYMQEETFQLPLVLASVKTAGKLPIWKLYWSNIQL